MAKVRTESPEGGVRPKAPPAPPPRPPKRMVYEGLIQKRRDMSEDVIKTKTVVVTVQENGVVRDLSGTIVGRFDDVQFDDILDSSEVVNHNKIMLDNDFERLEMIKGDLKVRDSYASRELELGKRMLLASIAIVVSLQMIAVAISWG